MLFGGDIGVRAVKQKDCVDDLRTNRLTLQIIDNRLARMLYSFLPEHTLFLLPPSLPPFALTFGQVLGHVTFLDDVIIVTLSYTISQLCSKEHLPPGALLVLEKVRTPKLGYPRHGQLMLICKYRCCGLMLIY